MEELINQAKCGNEKAFIELIDSIKIDLYKIARTRLIVNDDIEDAVQEITFDYITNTQNFHEKRCSHHGEHLSAFLYFFWLNTLII